MWREPEILAPLRGFFSPNSLRQAIKPRRREERSRKREGMRRSQRKNSISQFRIKKRKNDDDEAYRAFLPQRGRVPSGVKRERREGEEKEDHERREEGREGKGRERREGEKKVDLMCDFQTQTRRVRTTTN
jgi:hypothetical protein